MAYHLDIAKKERAYLDNLPLSQAARTAIDNFIEAAIAQVSDEFRNDPANRPFPDRPYFRRSLVFMDVDAQGTRSFHTVRFTVNDDGARFGVLLIVWVDFE